MPATPKSLYSLDFTAPDVAAETGLRENARAFVYAGMDPRAFEPVNKSLPMFERAWIGHHPVLDLDANPPDPALVARLAPDRCLRLGLVPWRRIGGSTLIAVADPDTFAAQQADLETLFGPVSCAVAPINAIQSHIARLGRDFLSRRADMLCPGDYSCRNAARPVKWVYLALLGGMFAAACLILPRLVLVIFIAWLFIYQISTGILRLLALTSRVRSGRSGDKPITQPMTPNGQPDTAPVVSILVPLYHESRILPDLIRRLQTTTYPTNRLDVCLVLEADDAITSAAIAGISLPDWIRTVTVPRAKLKTKPRAMNYALDFCRGSIVGIYDAEDAPEADQIDRVVRHFQAAPPEVACIQGYLDFYNAKQNWLSRCFSIEYAIWFRVILHGIDTLGLPVPLGGTTVFFRREALEKIGAWDAHNVTEDADLGFRLARLGYRCDFLATTTHEEANCHPRNWVKQRSRWLKGYAITWLSHMRRPVELWRDLGAAGFLAFQVLLLGTVTNFLVAPLIWSLWLVAFGGSLPFYDLIPKLVWQALAAGFIASELILLVIGVYAVSGPNHRHLIPYVPSMILYWPLGTLAAFKAAYELLRSPFFWDKTQHGQHSSTPTNTAVIHPS